MSTKWINHWLDVADATANIVKCNKRKVGAVIVTRDNRIVATGYNGAPRGFNDKGDADCRQFCPAAQMNLAAKANDYQNCVAVHAEINALLHADRLSMDSGSVYISCAPCMSCAKAIANSGLVQVFWKASDKDSSAVRDYFAQCGLKAKEITDDVTA